MTEQKDTEKRKSCLNDFYSLINFIHNKMKQYLCIYLRFSKKELSTVSQELTSCSLKVKLNC